MRVTTIEPGGEGSFSISHVMGSAMYTPHVYEFTVTSNDPVEPEKKIAFQVDYVQGEEDGD